MDRRGASTTKIQIILKLSENEDGIRKREDFIESNPGATKKVKDINLLSEDLKKSIEKKQDSTGNKGVQIVEKSIHELERKHGLIEKSYIGEGIFKKKAYKLKCQNLYELSRIFNYISDSDNKIGNNYQRLRKFIGSEFYKRAIEKYLMDVIYYFNLWDEKKYPVRSESYIRIFNEIQKDLISQPSKNIAVGSINYSGTFCNGGWKRLKIPSFWRENFPDEGPSEYEKKLRESGYEKTLQGYFLPQITELEDPSEIISFFRFIKKEFDKEEGPVLIKEPDLLDHWFIRFWYGTLAFSEKYWMPQHGVICLPEQYYLYFGSYDFDDNLKPLSIASRLTDEKVYQSYLDLTKGRKKFPSSFELFGGVPRSEPKTELTSEGKKFLNSILKSISKDFHFEADYLENMEKEAGFFFRIMPLPSLKPYLDHRSP